MPASAQNEAPPSRNSAIVVETSLLIGIPTIVNARIGFPPMA
jgi:hypothetical protein